MAQSVKNSPCNATDVDSVSRLGRHDKESDMTEQLTLSLFIYIYVCMCVYVYIRGGVQLFATQWTEAHQASLSTEFFRQQY